MWLNHFTKTNLYKSLNKEQQDAVSLSPYHHGLVIAGAGSGKTKTLITRICALIQSKTFQPNEIVALTFTNKAANEMKERLETILKEQVNLVNIGTFHSFALKLIKEDLEGFGFQQKIKLFDERDQLTFIKEMFYEYRWDEKNNAVNKLADFINHQKENGIRSQSFIKKGNALKATKTLIQQYQVYENLVKEKSILDFTEMVLLLNERLKQDNIYRTHLQERFKTYLVDEFQDTNPIQYETLLLLTENKNNIFAVGDDCQSIYSFRGAEVKNIFEFKEMVQDHYVKLEQNYRSSKNIVEISNEFISHAKEKIDKNLKTENEEGNKIFVYKALNEYDEADFIRKNIESILLKEKAQYSDFCVLYRGNAQSAKVETALTLAKIPFKVSGGMSFFDKAEIKTLLACAKLLIDPNDHNAFIRVIDKLKPVKINKKIMEGWNIESELEKLSFSELVTERKGLKYPQLIRFYQLIDKGQEEFKFSSLSESFEDFLKSINFFEYIKSEKNSDQKLENIYFFLKQLEQYEKEGGTSFIHFFYKIEQTLNLIQEQNQQHNLVNLMTIHASKGLEFKYVFFIGIEDGVIPSTPSIENNNIEEERRLMYVGMTRAKKELYLSFCVNRFNGYENVSYLPSRFLLDLNVKYLNPLNTVWLPDPLPYSLLTDQEDNIAHKYNLENFTTSSEYREQAQIIQQDALQKHQAFLNNLNVENFDQLDSQSISKEEVSYEIGQQCKTKFGLGKIVKIQTNEYDECVLTIEMANNDWKEILPDYDNIDIISNLD